MKKWFLLVFLFHFINEGKAQTDTTLLLLPVSVTSTQIQHFEKGRSINEFDSLKLCQYSGQSLGDILSNETGVFIKERSPGNLSTPSIRGTGFGHVAILWNGFAVQSPMNGGIDFSIFSTDAYNKISLIKGGNSAIYGSGAIGGTISLENNLKLNQGWKGQFLTNVNSNKNLGFHGNATFSTDILAFNINLNYQNNRNEYSFGKKKTTQKNAHHLLESQGFNFLLKLKKNQFLKFWTYFDNINRDISPSRTAAYNDEKMKTKSAKIGAEWALLNSKSKQTIRIGYFRDSLNFSSQSIYSQNRTDVVIGQFLSKHYFKNNLKWEWGFQEEYALARGNNIIKASRNQLAAFSNLAYDWNQWSASFSVREAFLDDKIVPFTFTLGTQYSFNDFLNLKGNISKNFRAPTLNDLYWPALGNANLKSENGWSGEIGFDYRYMNFLFSSTYFHISGTDWIIWSPNNIGLWTPDNNLKVVSNGLESGLSYQKQFNDWQLKLSSSLTLTKSVLKDNYSTKGDTDIGKQLIYVPKIRALGNLEISYWKLKLNYQHRFTSSVRTTQRQLPGYSIGNVALNYQPYILKKRLSVKLEVENIWNQDYEVVSYYPMPLRYFTIGVGLFF